MKLSGLQKYILLACLNAPKGRIFRDSLINFYSQTKKPPKKELMVKIITKSIDRLIKRDLIVGFGEITSERQFIREIKNTAEGRRIAKTLWGEQMRIPLKNQKVKVKIKK